MCKEPALLLVRFLFGEGEAQGTTLVVLKLVGW